MDPTLRGRDHPLAEHTLPPGEQFRRLDPPEWPAWHRVAEWPAEYVAQHEPVILDDPQPPTPPVPIDRELEAQLLAGYREQATSRSPAEYRALYQQEFEPPEPPESA